MTCDEIKLQIDAYIDHELDAAHALDIERHIEHCAACGQLYQSHLQLHNVLAQSQLYETAPETLRQRLIQQTFSAPLAKSDQPTQPLPPTRTLWRRYAGIAASIMLAAALGWQASEWFHRPPSINTLADAAIAAHVRSMMPGHLTDVASTDQHTVKPWFGGKLDFSPPVTDPATSGFPLVGGRLDFLDGHPVAALVYQRRKHVINLFVWPAENQRNQDLTATSHRGFNVLIWAQHGWQYQAVSDVNDSELRAFAALIMQ